MNKHLFVIFLSLLSSTICASSLPTYFDFPGQHGPVRPLSPQKGVPYGSDDAAYWSQVPSQSASSHSTPASSNQPSPEMQRSILVILLRTSDKDKEQQAKEIAAFVEGSAK